MDLLSYTPHYPFFFLSVSLNNSSALGFRKRVVDNGGGGGSVFFFFLLFILSEHVDFGFPIKRRNISASQCVPPRVS